MAVVSALNQKGGVGKSSTCHHLAGTLAQMGRTVLLIDADPQASLSQGFWGPVAAKGLDPSATIAAIFAGDRPYPEQVIHPTGVAGRRPGPRLASGRLVQRPRPPARRPRAAGMPPRVPRRREGPVRPRADRLPAEPPHGVLGGPGGQRLPDRPPRPRGLREPGPVGRDGLPGDGAGPGEPGRPAPWLPAHDGRAEADHPPDLRGARCGASTGRRSSRPACPRPWITSRRSRSGCRSRSTRAKGAAAKAIRAVADEMLARIEAIGSDHPDGGRLRCPSETN